MELKTDKVSNNGKMDLSTTATGLIIPWRDKVITNYLMEANMMENGQITNSTDKVNRHGQTVECTQALSIME